MTSTSRFIFCPDAEALRGIIGVVVRCILQINTDIHRMRDTTKPAITVHSTFRRVKGTIFFGILYYPKDSRDGNSS
jgi:hypothetical protein